MSLSALSVKRESTPGRYSDGKGLYLQVRSSENKSWLFRYQYNYKQREMGLGPYPEISLSEARMKRDRWRKVLKDPDDPRDPLEVREEELKSKQRKKMTFSEAMEKCIEQKRAGWNNPKSEVQWRSSLTQYVVPTLGEMPVESITTAHVFQVLQPIWATKTETAIRLRSRIETIIGWAKSAGEPVTDNPAVWKNNLSNMLAAPRAVSGKNNFPALPYREIAPLYAELSLQKGTGAYALRYLILTAARTTEVRECTWDEIDLPEKLWRIPGERMKAGKPHEVPLSDEALNLLNTMKQIRHRGFVFSASGHKPISSATMAAVLKRMNRLDITVHGFRSTFRDWAGEATNHQREVIENALDVPPTSVALGSRVRE